MAQIAGTFTTNDAVGNREDLIEEITNISPTKTPFLSMSRRSRARARLHEWQTDSLAAADLNNAAIEGDDVQVFDAVTPTARLTNEVQTFTKTLIVSTIQDEVNKAGRKTEFGYQMTKKLKELARDIEANLMQNTAKVVGTDDTAAKLAGVKGWLDTTLGGTNRQNASGQAVDQTDLETITELVFKKGGDPDVILCGARNKRIISGLTTGVTKNLDALDKKLTYAVDVYESDFGIMKIIPDLFQDPAEVYVLQMDLWAVAQLYGTRVEKLGKTGLAEKALVSTAITLCAKQEAGNGVIHNTTGV